jgi:hypothetical protein
MLWLGSLDEVIDPGHSRSGTLQRFGVVQPAGVDLDKVDRVGGRAWARTPSSSPSVLTLKASPGPNTSSNRCHFQDKHRSNAAGDRLGWVGR